MQLGIGLVKFLGLETEVTKPFIDNKNQTNSFQNYQAI